jgi:membrane-associated phospholipid phosphatase
MRTKTGKPQAWLPGLSQILDIAAPVVAILITAILVTERTPRREPFLYAVVLAALITLTWASARSRSDYGLWALYIGGFAIFSVARSFADETGVQTHFDDLIRVDKTLAFGAVPTVWLQSRFFDPTHIGWLDRATTYVHWSYFVLPHLFAAHLFFGKRHLFERYVLLFVGVLMAGLVIYFMFPAAPPWAASLTGHLDPTYKVVTEVGSEWNVDLYAKFETQIRSSNPVAAMPSLHMAVSVAVLLVAFRANWLLGILALAYNAAMAFSLVYLGEHYVVDILAGILMTFTVYVALSLWFRLRERERGLGPSAAPVPVADGAPQMQPQSASEAGYSGPAFD